MPFLCSIPYAVCGQSSFLHRECCVVFKSTTDSILYFLFVFFFFFQFFSVFLCDFWSNLFPVCAVLCVFNCFWTCIAACAMQNDLHSLNPAASFGLQTWCNTFNLQMQSSLPEHHTLVFSWKEACSWTYLMFWFWFCFEHKFFFLFSITRPLTVSSPLWSMGRRHSFLQKLSFLVQYSGLILIHYC